jgi:hypothetical protein
MAPYGYMILLVLMMTGVLGLRDLAHHELGDLDAVRMAS